MEKQSKIDVGIYQLYLPSQILMKAAKDEWSVEALYVKENIKRVEHVIENGGVLVLPSDTVSAGIRHYELKKVDTKVPDVVIPDSILDKALTDNKSKEYSLCIEIFGSEQKVVEYKQNKFSFRIGV